MGAGVKAWYQQNFDRLLQPELWSLLVSDDSNKVTLLTKRLSEVARDFFRGTRESHPRETPTLSEERADNDPLYQFIALGEKNAWIEPEKIERLHRLAQDAGQILAIKAVEKPAIDPQELKQAFEKEDLDKIMALISQGADIHSADANGANLLHYGAWNNSSDILTKLINLGADISRSNNYGYTPLHFAARYGHLDCIKLLCEAGADIDFQEEYGRTPLHLAAQCGHTDCIKMLCEAGADINCLDEYGRTPLNYAVLVDRLEVVKLLLVLGANPRVEDANALNPLSVAITLRSEHYKEIKLLLEQSTEALQSSKKTIKERFLGHVAELDDRSELWNLGDRSFIKGKLAEPGGLFAAYNFTKIRKSLREFSREFPTILSSGMSGMIQSTTASNCRSEQSAADLMKRWESRKPILINTGFSRHYVSILIWKDRFVLCDRGAGASNEAFKKGKTLKVFSFDSKKLIKEIIEKIINSKTGSIESYRKLIQTELPQLLGFTHTAVDEKIESAGLPSQIIGNCGYANAEGNILPLMILSKLYQLSPDLNQLKGEDIDQTVNEQKSAFTNWQASLLLRALEKDLKWVKDPRNCFIPNFALVKGAFNRFAATHSVLPELKAKAQELEMEWNQVEKRIPPPSRFEKAYYYFGIDTLVKMMPQRRKPESK